MGICREADEPLHGSCGAPADGIERVTRVAQPACCAVMRACNVLCCMVAGWLRLQLLHHAAVPQRFTCVFSCSTWPCSLLTPSCPTPPYCRTHTAVVRLFVDLLVDFLGRARNDAHPRTTQAWRNGPIGS